MTIGQGKLLEYMINQHRGLNNDADKNEISYYYARNIKNGYVVKTEPSNGYVQMRPGTQKQNTTPFSSPIRYLHEAVFDDGSTRFLLARADDGWYKFNDSTSEFEALRSPIGIGRTVDAKKCKATNYNSATYLTDGDRNIFVTSDGKAYFYGNHMIISDDGLSVTFYSFSITETRTDGVTTTTNTANDVQITLTYPTDVQVGESTGDGDYVVALEFQGDGSLIGKFFNVPFTEYPRGDNFFSVGTVTVSGGKITVAAVENIVTPTYSYCCINNNGLWLDDTNGTVYDNSGTYFSNTTIDSSEGTVTNTTDVTERIAIDINDELYNPDEFIDLNILKKNYLVIHTKSGNLIYYTPAVKSQTRIVGESPEGTIAPNSSVVMGNEIYSPSPNFIAGSREGTQYQEFDNDNDLTYGNRQMYRDYIENCSDIEAICGVFDKKRQLYYITIPQTGGGAKTMVYSRDLDNFCGEWEFPWTPTSWLALEDGTVYIGCSDGYMRKLDESYYSDDGTAINFIYLSNNLGGDYPRNFKGLLEGSIFFEYETEVKDAITVTYYRNYNSYETDYDIRPESTKKLFHPNNYMAKGRGKWIQVKIDYTASENRIKLISTTIMAEKEGFM